MLKFQRVIVPIDLSPCSDQALHYAVELAEKFHSQLILVYVIPELSTLVADAVMPVPTAGPDLDQTLASARETVEELIREKNLERFSTTYELRFGSPASEIVTVATEQQADLIVICTHGRTGISHFFLGSVAESVIRSAHCPVLTVHVKDHE
jgi:nucleotide-binding universal stress UspA family protein